MRPSIRTLFVRIEDLAGDVYKRQPYVLDSRGFTYLKMKKYDLAIKDYDLAIAGNEKNAAYFYGRSLARKGIHDAAGAKADLDLSLIHI